MPFVSLFLPLVLIRNDQRMGRKCKPFSRITHHLDIYFGCGVVEVVVGVAEKKSSLSSVTVGVAMGRVAGPPLREFHVLPRTVKNCPRASPVCAAVALRHWAFFAYGGELCVIFHWLVADIVGRPATGHVRQFEGPGLLSLRGRSAGDSAIERDCSLSQRWRLCFGERVRGVDLPHLHWLL